MAARTEVTVVADVHEAPSGVVEALERLGARVVQLALPVGDYRIAERVLVERRTVGDLHDSVVEGRFWSRLGALRDGCDVPYLVVEGRVLDAGPLSPAAVRGVCVAVIDRGVRLLRSDSASDTARWLVRLGVRHTRAGPCDRATYAQRPPVTGSAAEAALAAIPGISVVSARALLDRFGSVACVATAMTAELASVPGIGAARARAIRTTLNPT